MTDACHGEGFRAHPLQPLRRKVWRGHTARKCVPALSLQHRKAIWSDPFVSFFCCCVSGPMLIHWPAPENLREPSYDFIPRNLEEFFSWCTTGCQLPMHHTFVLLRVTRSEICHQLKRRGDRRRSVRFCNPVFHRPRSAPNLQEVWKRRIEEHIYKTFEDGVLQQESTAQASTWPT